MPRIMGARSFSSDGFRSLSSQSSLFERTSAQIPSGFELELRRLCKSGELNLEGAIFYFDKLIETRPIPSIGTFNHVLGSVSKLKGYSEVPSMYKRMRDEGVKSDLYTSSILINVFCHLKKINYGFGVLGDTMKRGLEADSVMVQTLVKGLCSEGKVFDAVQVFDKISEKGLGRDSGCEANVLSYGMIIHSLIKNCSLDRAVVVFQKMIDHGVAPNVIVFADLINGLSSSGRLREALELFDEMVVRGISPNLIVYNSLIRGCCKLGMWEEVAKMIQKMAREGLSPDVYTYSILIDSLCKVKKVNEAIQVFESMLDRGIEPSLHTYTSLLAGLFTVNRSKDAVELFESLRHGNLRPNAVTYNIMLHGLCKSKKLSEARELLVEMETKGCSPNANSFNTVIWGFLNGEKIEDAVQLLESMLERNFSPCEAVKSKLSRIFTDSEGHRTLQTLLDAYGEKIF